MALKLDEKLDAQLIRQIDNNTRLDWFDSPQEFADAVDRIKLNDVGERARNGNNASFYGKESYAEAKELVSKGWPHVIKDAEKIIQQIEDEGLLSMGYKGWTQSVAGAFPNVPAAIIGAPESMFDHAEAKAETSAIRVFVDQVMACHISPEALLKRGTAIAALVLGLSAKRPVELYTFAGIESYPNGKSHGMGLSAALTRIETRPMDIAALSYCLASASFYRRLQFMWASQFGFSNWYAYGHNPDSAQYEPAIRRGLQMEPQDILIPGATSQNLMMRDPVQWVREALAIHLIENQNAEDDAA